MTIDDAVYERVRVNAASGGRTVGSVIGEALRRYLLDADSAQASPAPILPTMRCGGPRPGVDLDDMSAVRDLLAEGTPLDAFR